MRKGIEFEKELDEAVHVDESELQYFFKDLSTHCSIARMLIMPYTFMGEAQSGKFFFEELLNMNPQQRIKKMCCHMQNFDSSQNFDYEPRGVCNEIADKRHEQAEYCGMLQQLRAELHAA